MISSLIVVLHVLTVFLLLGGVLGRDVTYRQAAKATDLVRLRHLVELGSIFERRMVRPTTGWVLLSGLGAAWARGWPILGLHHGPHWVLAAILLYLTIVPWIVFVFIPRGRAFQAALEEATQQNEITARLKAALHDPVVEAGRGYELVMVAVLAWLMIARPF